MTSNPVNKSMRYTRNLLSRQRMVQSSGNDTEREKNNNTINSKHKQQVTENNGKNETGKIREETSKLALPGKRKIDASSTPASVQDDQNNSRCEYHRGSTIDMLDIEKTKQSMKNELLPEKHGKSGVEFFPKPKKKTDIAGELYNCVFVQLSDKTDKKFKIDNERKSRREKLEDLKKKSMRKCGSDSMEHSAVYLSMLESYDEVIEDDIFKECKILDTHDHYEGQCRSRSLSDFEKEAFFRRDLVLTELLDSEKHYIDDLEFIVEKYLPLMTPEHVTEDLVYTCDIIYMNIVDIRLFHVQTFHDQIVKCFENPDLLDEAFTTYEEQLTALYTLYCGQKPIADESLKEHEEELDELCHRMFPDVKLRIKDYLIKPVQRLMKYQLLLTSIKKYGIKAGKDSTYLDNAIGAMERVPKEANDAMHVGLITGYDGTGCSVKQLLMHGQLEVGVGNRKARTMHVFLFETLCLFTEKASKLVPEYKCIYSDDNSGLRFTTNSNLTFVMGFRKHNKTDIYKCEAATQDDKEQWSCKLKQAMSYKDIQQRKLSCRRQLTIEIAPPDDVEIPTSIHQFETLMIEEAVVKAMMGHPRLGIMSERLKSNIERYIADEFIIPTISDKSPLSRHKTITHRDAASTTSLDTGTDLFPRRPMSSESTGRRSVSPPKRKGKKSKKDKEKDAARRARSKSLINFSSSS